MTVSFQGLDCLADVNSPYYSIYGDESQAQVPWASQPKYGFYTVYYGAATIFVVLVKYFFTYYRDKRLARGNRHSTGLCSSVFDVAAAYCRLVGYKPTPKFLMMLSFPRNIGQVLYALSTSIYLFCVCLIPHFWYRACYGFGSPPLAIRAGIMAAAVVPFIFMLSGKNNFVSYFTGIGYEKLNWLHQLLGLSCFVLAIIHVVPFIAQPLREGGALNLKDVFLNSDDYQHGIVPFVCLFGLVALFNRHIRKRVYEVSFHFHWIIGCAFFAFLMRHVYGMLDMQNYLWATLAIWFTQWLYRVFKSGMSSVREAEIVKLGDNTMQVSVFNVKGYSWAPGQHCFLRFPGIRVFDNHPFSIASVVEEDYMKFIVVPKKGLTKKMHDLLDKEVQKQKVLVDGPYGGSNRDPMAFDKVHLLCTGSGITATLPFLTQIAQSENGPDVILFWVVRYFEDVKWVTLEIEHCLAVGGKRVQVIISIASNEILGEKLLIDGARFLTGKPDFQQVVSAFGLELKTRNMFVSSGSHSMCQDVALAVSRLQLHVIGGGLAAVEEVYLHSEIYGW